MSSSPAAKRNLKPSPIAATTQQPGSQFTAASELPSTSAHTVAAGNPNQNPGAESSFPTYSQPTSPGSSRKRKSLVATQEQMANIAQAQAQAGASAETTGDTTSAGNVDPPAGEPKAKKSRTNTPWTPAEEQRLKKMRDEGHSWSEIAKTFPARTEGSVKKHWYKDMHYAEFGEDESQALFAAIKEYESNKWKVIGQKVGKPAKACEQYAKEHFQGKV